MKDPAVRDEKKQYHHGNLREELVRLGLEELERNDKDDLSLRDIAEKAGVSKTAPYRHFADKDALLAAITTEGFRRFGDRLKEVLERRDGDGIWVITEMCRVYIQFARSNPKLYHLMFSSFGRLLEDPHCAQEGRRSLDQLREAVKIWLPQRPAEEIETHVIAIWGYIHGLASLSLEGFLPAETWETALGDRLLTHFPEIKPASQDP
jgi:AcrR family transcriptional regulator